MKSVTPQQRPPDFITGLLDDKEAPCPVRLNAALKVLDLAGT